MSSLLGLFGPNKSLEIRMLTLLITAAVLSACSAAKKPIETTLLQCQYHGSEAALNKSATQWFSKIHDELPSQAPKVATALSKLSVDEFRAAVLALTQRNITENSPKCANDSHLPVHKCLDRSNATALREVRTIVNAQKRACNAGISSLVDWSFESAVSECFTPSNGSCATQAPACVRNLVQDLDTKLSNMLTGPRLGNRDDVSSIDSNSTSTNYTALQRSHRKLAVDMVVVTAIGNAFAILFFLAKPVTETMLPVIFLSTALGRAGEELRKDHRD